MRPVFPVLAVLLALSNTACTPRWTQTAPVAASQKAQAQSSELDAIAEFEDRRSYGEGRLPALALTAADPATRRRAVLALGRIQDPSAVETLVKAMSDADAKVRGEVAFASGLIGLSWVPLKPELKTQLADALLEAESTETVLEVKLALIDALGKVVLPATTERLIDRLPNDGDVQSRAALALGVSMKNGATLTARAIAALTPLLKKELPPATRYSAAYALMQSKVAVARPGLLTCTADDASDVRALCAKGLGDVGTEVDAVTLKKLIDDPDYRVAVEAVRSLAKLASKCKSAACPALGALNDLSLRAERFVRGDTTGGGQPILTLAQSPLPASAKPLLISMRSQLAGAKTASDQRVKQDAANLDCRLAAALDRLAGSLNEVLGCGAGLIDEPRRLALGLHELATLPAADPVKRAADVGAYVYHVDPRVKLAAIELLGETKAPASIEKVRTQLASDDLVLAGAAATAASKLKDTASIASIRALARRAGAQVDVAIVVADALATLEAKEAIGELEPWLNSTHATIRAAAAEALTKLTGKPVTPLRVERPVDTTKPPRIPRDAKLVVVTEKGEFEIELFTDDAPLTSTNLYTLARRGYFRNVTFHRIVPDFVAQGGDPRGDGEGGPGYSIRCEINRRPYLRGTVGMALSGKDTGGSQFFVALSAQPHLDGRYTTFGTVKSGIEVVDSLLEGDRIIDVRATP